jgi:YjbE family integral membrane protein
MLEAYQAELVALLQIIVIDVVLAGDNAIVVGMAASRVAPEMRAKVIFWGIAGAVVLRIAFAAVTVQLLAIVGLTLAGGILLMWVCWKMYRELRPAPHGASAGAAVSHGTGVDAGKPMSVWSAIGQIIVADVSMSLDNVLAVAGAAKGHTTSLVIGLAIAVVLMAVAATVIARLLARYPWITWLGLFVVLYVALDMMWRGTLEVVCVYVPEAVCKQGLIPSMGALLGTVGP